MILLLLLLVAVPVIVRMWAKRHAPRHLGAITGTGLGLVASPVSLGLYATYFIGPFGLVTGMAGLFLVSWHASPGYYLSTALGFVPTHTVVKGASHIVVEMSNGIFWGAVYGALGFAIDRLRLKRKVHHGD